MRALLIAEAELGERIMRALILRRVGLIQTGAGGPVLIGAPESAGMLRLQGFLSRNGHPHTVLDPALDHAAAELMKRYVAARGRAAAGGLSRRHGADATPTEQELARWLGLMPATAAAITSTTSRSSAPARPGSRPRCTRRRKGCRSLVLDTRVIGGQAGASSRIENYLGFPTGISGPGADRTRLRAGAEIRRRDDDAGRGDAARLRARRRRVR